MKNNKTMIVLACAILIAIAITGYLLMTKKNAVSVQVETVTAKNGNIRKVVTATGTIEPIKQVSVGTQVSGVVQKVYADYNSKVKAGQLIAELDKTNLRAAVADAKAAYKTSLNEQDYLQKIYDRQENLFKSKVISQADFEEAVYKLNNAKGAVEQRKSDLNRAETNLGYADIYSPIEGVVLAKSVDVGQTVAASFSTPTLFTIAQDLSEIQVEANVDEADIGDVTEGQRVTFVVDAFPGEEFSGKVTQVRLNGVVKSNVVTYTVVISAENPAQKLKPGLTATISIYTMELNDVLTVDAKAIDYQPDQALLQKYNSKFHGNDPPPPNPANPAAPPKMSTDGNIKTVWMKGENGLFPHPVTIGKKDRVNVQIVEGLKSGDQVVTGLSAGNVAERSEVSGSSSGSSPFMPAPPGKKK